jgi:hypothetical protein
VGAAKKRMRRHSNKSDAAGPQHAISLSNGSGIVINVLKKVECCDDVETAGCKWNRLRVCTDQVRDPSAARKPQSLFRKIHTAGRPAVAFLGKKQSGSATNVQQAWPRTSARWGMSGDEPPH